MSTIGATNLVHHRHIHPVMIDKPGKRILFPDDSLEFPRLEPGEVNTWLSGTVSDPERLSYLASLLDNNEQKKADRFKFDRHRNQYISAQGTLRVLLGRYLGQSPEHLNFRYTDFGKPYLAKSTDLRFNLSHSHGKIVFAFAIGIELGIDIEFVDPRHRDFDLAKRFFHPLEIDALARIDDAERMELFYTIWTAKEALLKACGKGLSIPLRDFAVIDDKGRMLKNVQVEDNRWFVRRIDDVSGFKAALASSVKCNELIMLLH